MVKSRIVSQFQGALRTLHEGFRAECLQVQHPCWGYTTCEGHQKVLLEQGPLLNIFQHPLPPPSCTVYARMRAAQSPLSPAPPSPGGMSMVQAPWATSPQACRAKLLKIPSTPLGGDS